MKILRDHLLKEFFVTFFSCLVGLLLAFLLGRGLVQMADLIFNKDVDVFLIVKILFYSMPFLLTFIIPMSVLIATLLAFGKLSADHEITAIRACGISIFKLSKPLFISVILLCLASFVMSDQIASQTHYMYRQTLAKIGLENPTAALEEGLFIKKFRNFVIFVYEIDKKKLKGIHIYQRQEGKPTRTIMAQKGEFISIPEKNIVKLKLVQGVSDEPDPKDPSKLYKLAFKTYDLPLTIQDTKHAQQLTKKPKDMSNRELKAEIRALGESGIKEAYRLASEIHNKYAVALSSLAFLLVGIPLGIQTRRSEKSVGFAISLLVMAFYWAFLLAGKSLAQKGSVPAWAGLQIANSLLTVLGAFLFYRLEKN